ncbi:MAG: histidine kinase, partial [Micavibrio aeruginosavorus]
MAKFQKGSSVSKVFNNSRFGGNANPSIHIGLGILVAFFFFSGWIASKNIQTLQQNTVLVTRTHETLTALRDVLSVFKDAETGQRGYLLTGDENYLAPYNKALADIEENLVTLEELTEYNMTQRDSLAILKNHIGKKLAELEATINIRRTEGFQPALALVKNGEGRAEMDAIRRILSTMEGTEQLVRNERISDMQRAYRTTAVHIILTSIVGLILAVVAFILIRRAINARARQNWLQKGEAALAKATVGDQTPETLGENILRFFADYLHIQAGAFYV